MSKRSFLLSLSVLALMGTVAHAQAPVFQIEPDNEGFHCIPKSEKTYPLVGLISSGLSEDQYNKVLDRVESLYSGEVQLMGGELAIVRDWSDPTPNSYADRPYWQENRWEVVMLGGLARNPYMTEDALTLVACHELGHHIGGAPKVHYYSPWASNEGQADYFATLKCMRRVFTGDDNSTIAVQSTVPDALKKACEKEFATDAEGAAVCVRSIQAGMDISKVFADLTYQATGLTQEAAFNKVNGHVVAATSNSHPAVQCRFDTYRAGALCPIGVDKPVSQSDVAPGTCNRVDGFSVLEVRPTCWFNPG
jgi:hypothetical protein